MVEEPLLTVHEVADRLKVKESTVRNWIRSGKLRAIKLEKDWRIQNRDLDAFLDDHANR